MSLLIKFHKMRQETIVIIGCGRLGSTLASMLSEQNKKVTIMDINQNSFRKLASSYGGFSIEGDGSDIDMLTYAGTDKADVLIACTDDDDTNIMIVQIAKMRFHIKNAIARLHDSSKQAAFCDMDIKSICPDLLSVNEFIRIMDVKDNNSEEQGATK